MKSLFLVTLCCCWTSLVCAKSIYEAIENNPKLSKFYDLTKNDELVQVLLKKRRVTVFVPSNEAFSRARQFAPEDEERLASYHIVSMVVTRDLFPDSIYAVSQENPPLYFSVKEQPGNGEKEYFVNNAKLLEDRDYNVDDGKQKLYIIDEVLEPYRSTENLPPDAWELLSNPSLYNIREELSAMASRVRKEEQVDTFTKVGNHTYFIPIGEENGPTGSRIRDVDSNVIKGHVISHYVLFTRTAGNEGYISNNPRVEIKFVNQSNSFDSETIFVRSNTFQENQAHHKGVVLSKIVRANIPLRNGVVHLIEHPLMIIDISVWDFIQSKGDKKLSEYMQLVKEASPDFDFNIRNAVEKTVFVPTNEAIQEVEPEKLEMLKANKTELTNLLRLHMTQKAISTDDVWRHGRHYEIITADNQRTMYFRAVGNYKNKSLTVEAGGVNATVVEADIGATNGIIHVIDRVLGLPYQTIMEKLSSDPDLRRTFQLSKHNIWNLKLNNREKLFTFFVPGQKAWDDFRSEMPNEYNQMTMDVYKYHVQKILDRHLVVGDEISSQELERKDNLQMVNGVVDVKRGLGNADVYLEWEGIQAVIVRPDVQATNGVIHVIDRVLMKQRDMMRTGGTPGFYPSLVLCVSTLLVHWM